MRIPIANEGWRVIGTLFLSAWLLPKLPFLGWTGLLLWPLAFFSITFFRDPDREITRGENLILCPADGTIVRIADVEEPHFFKGPARVVCIFMSPLNCHINRAPIAGRVLYSQYNPGAFEMAWRDKASELNEQHTIGIQGDTIKVMCRQIAGFLARRIICRARVDDVVGIGERYGLIQFGSRVDVYLPLDAAVHVKIDQQVKGGLTVLGEYV